MSGLFIVFLAATAGTMFGLAINGYMLRKLRYFEDLVLLTERLQSDIQFSQLSIDGILCAYVTQSAALNKNIAEYRQFLQGGELHLSAGQLKKREFESVKYFFSRLGTLDYDTQLSEISLQKEEFLRKRDIERERHKKYSALYVKLGFLAGLCVGILML